jgi:hypothetical protein
MSLMRDERVSAENAFMLALHAGFALPECGGGLERSRSPSRVLCSLQFAIVVRLVETCSGWGWFVPYQCRPPHTI